MSDYAETKDGYKVYGKGAKKYIKAPCEGCGRLQRVYEKEQDDECCPLCGRKDPAGEKKKSRRRKK